ncbi:potassium channel family protein [Halostagnicola kamekurae]|uniref:Trk K+ transport system, NAD-binding component n=1 Tax=Halostagnicola kamekurae TaxID=619731 RepID=A0A1I6SDB0_9EURY|nr:NAD(P)-binding protein [Halostagnicola kamekurae]SFS74903.1 Trk K+ transport system, NAD-binding component [Halostagnicola kamekurae]
MTVRGEDRCGSNGFDTTRYWRRTGAGWVSVLSLRRRIELYVGSLLLLVILYTVVYRWGMAAFEDDPRNWYRAFEIVVQSMTTTGYGQDAPWESLQMTALIVLIQLTGIAYIFVAFPVFVVPWVAEIAEPTPPERIGDLQDHVIIVGYTELSRVLVEELNSSRTPYVIIEQSSSRALALDERGYAVLYGDPSSEETLEAAQIETASTILVDATEHQYIRVVLACDERDVDATVLALVTDPSRAQYLRYAGADEVLSPKHRLGKSLGDKVRNVIELSEDILTDEGSRYPAGELEVAELPIGPDGQLYDETLDAARRLERHGVTVLGVWVRGDFLTSLPPTVHADENTTLLVVGNEGDLDAVEPIVGSNRYRYESGRGPVVIVGAGIVGRTAMGTLERVGIETTLVDREDGQFVDVVGDATTVETLTAADIAEAKTLLIALDNDDDAILATLVARSLADELEIIVASDREASVSRLRTAGANDVLSLPNVVGRMILLRVFDRETMVLGERVSIARVETSDIATETFGRDELETIRDQTGCSVVGLEVDGHLRTDVRDRSLAGSDAVVIAGSQTEVADFLERYTSA